MADVGPTLCKQHGCSSCNRHAQGQFALSLFASQQRRLRSNGEVHLPSRKPATRSPAVSALQRQHHLHSDPQSSLFPQYQPAQLRGQFTAAAAGEASAAAEDRVPPGCSRYTVELRKPLGLVLEEDRHGNIFVAAVAENGNAARSDRIRKGDQLIATSGYVYSKETQYQEVKVRSGETVVRLNTRGEDFDTIMAAIRSHPSQMSVRLEFQSCE